jgi:hypothetical protein
MKSLIFLAAIAAVAGQAKFNAAAPQSEYASTRHQQTLP